MNESCCNHHTSQNECININLPYHAAFKGTQKHNGGHQCLSLFISCVSRVSVVVNGIFRNGPFVSIALEVDSSNEQTTHCAFSSSIL